MINLKKININNMNLRITYYGKAKKIRDFVIEMFVLIYEDNVG